MPADSDDEQEPASGSGSGRTGGFLERRRSAKLAKAKGRDAFETLAMQAALGDPAALARLPAETAAARALYGERDFDKRRLDVVTAAIREVIDDDLLTEAEDSHLAELLTALDVSVEALRASNFELVEEVSIARINDGRLPQVESAQLILKQGEVCHATFPASLMKDVAVRQYRAATSSVSIPLGGGVRYRVGGVRGRSVVVGTETIVADSGILAITSNRSLFSGRAKTLEFRHDRLVNLEEYRDGLRLAVSNRQTSSLFTMPKGASPSVAAALISACVGRL
jgi:hypothetical protein